MATRNECVDMVVKAGADAVEAENIVKNIEEYAKSSKSVEETAKKTKERFDNDVRKAILDRKNTLLTIVTRDALDSSYAKAQAEGVSFDDWLTGKMVGSHLSFAGSRDSVAKNFSGMMLNLQANIEKGINSIENAAALLEKKDGVFAKSVHTEMIAPGSTGDATARQVAQVFSDVLEDMRTRVNRAGGNIGKLDNYAPQSHDGDKLLKVTLNQWRDEIRDKIDWERSFPDVTDPQIQDEILAEIYMTITTGRSNKPTARQEGNIAYRPSTAAKGLEHERTLHFKDADAALAYHEKYGKGHIGNAVFSQAIRSAKRLALMESFGPNPEIMIVSLIEKHAETLRNAQEMDLPVLIGGKEGNALQKKVEKAEIKAAELQGKGLVDEAEKVMNGLQMDLHVARVEKINTTTGLFTGTRTGRIANYYKELTGETSIPHSPTGAKIAQGVRNGQSLSKLGGAVLSALSDILFKINAMTYNGENFLTAVAKSMPTSRHYKTQERKEIAQGLGIYAESFMREQINRFDTIDGAGGMTRWMDMFFKLSGLDAWTTGHEAAYKYYLSNRLANNVNKSFAELNKDYAVAFRRHNLHTRWELFRKMVRKAEDGNDYVLPENAFDLSDADLLPYMGEQWQESARPSSLVDLDAIIQKKHTKAAQRKIVRLAKLAGLDEDGIKKALDIPDIHNLSDLNTAEVSAFIKNQLDAGWGKKRQEAFAQERSRLATDVAGYFADELRYAVLAPDAKTSAFAKQGTQAGTAPGEIMRFVTQFKSFPIAYGQRILREGRMWRKAGDESPQFGYALRFAVMAMAFGYAAMTAKDLAKGREPRDPRKLETLIAALLQSGGLGIMGDMFLGNADRFGNQALASIAGPGLTEMTSLLAISGQLVRGDLEDAFDTGSSIALRNMPFLNLWWSRTVLDYMLLFHVREWMSPGTLKRSERRMKKDYNQEYFKLGGVDLTPSRKIKRGGGFK